MAAPSHTRIVPAKLRAGTTQEESEMSEPSILSRIVEAARRQAHREALHRHRDAREVEGRTRPAQETSADPGHAREQTRQQFAVWG
jgi:hypothetical protein